MRVDPEDVVLTSNFSPSYDEEGDENDEDDSLSRFAKEKSDEATNGFDDQKFSLAADEKAEVRRFRASLYSGRGDKV